jgi:hypothetical protein
MIFPSSFVELLVVDTHLPIGDSSLMNEFIFLIVDNSHPPFFGTTCTRLTHSLSETGQITPALSSFNTSFFTTSLIVLFSRH